MGALLSRMSIYIGCYSPTEEVVVRGEDDIMYLVRACRLFFKNLHHMCSQRRMVAGIVLAGIAYAYVYTDMLPALINGGDVTIRDPAIGYSRHEKDKNATSRHKLSHNSLASAPVETTRAPSKYKQEQHQMAFVTAVSWSPCVPLREI